VLHAQDHAENVRVERRGILSAVWSVIGPTLPSVPALFPRHRDGRTVRRLVDQSADDILLANIGVDELRSEPKSEVPLRAPADLITPTGNNDVAPFCQGQRRRRGLCL